MLSQRSISTMRKFDLHGSDFTARSAYSGRTKKGRSENEVQRGGGCAMPLRGQAPVTPNSLFLRSFHLATRYKTEIFVDGTRADAVDLPDMQIFKAQFRRDPTASAAHPN